MLQVVATHKDKTRCGWPGRLQGELSVAISVSNAFARSGGLGSSRMRRSLVRAGENNLSYDLGLIARRVRAWAL